MVDVSTVLQGVAERDKWRHRLDLLERSLDDARTRRRRIEARLRRLRKELNQLRVAADSMVTVVSPFPSAEVSSATHGPVIR